MSVLKLRRDQVVVEDEPEVEVVETASEAEDRPFPLRKIEPETTDVIEGELAEPVEEEHHSKTFFQHVRFWFNAIVIVAAILAYPVMVFLSADVGDRDIAAGVDRSAWASPWAGGTAGLMEKHFDQLGWASDSPGWSPMARLTAKPAYQSAMAGALGEFVKLTNTQATNSGRADADLEAASRLLSSAATAIQLRAARDALLNFDRRQKRRDASAFAHTPPQLSEQLALITSWAVKSQDEIAATANSLGGSPIDEAATRAVYAAKGRAIVAFILLDTLEWPNVPAAAEARNAALKAWKDAAQFHPLIVLNGDPDGSIFGNHPASMGFLLGQAQKATEEFLRLSGLTPAPAAQQPVAGAAVVNAAAAPAAK